MNFFSEFKQFKCEQSLAEGNPFYSYCRSNVRDNPHSTQLLTPKSEECFIQLIRTNWVDEKWTKDTTW